MDVGGNIRYRKDVLRNRNSFYVLRQKRLKLQSIGNDDWLDSRPSTDDSSLRSLPIPKPPKRAPLQRIDLHKWFLDTRPVLEHALFVRLQDINITVSHNPPVKKCKPQKSSFHGGPLYERKTLFGLRTAGHYHKEPGHSKPLDSRKSILYKALDYYQKQEEKARSTKKSSKRLRGSLEEEANKLDLFAGANVSDSDFEFEFESEKRSRVHFRIQKQARQSLYEHLVNYGMLGADPESEDVENKDNKGNRESKSTSGRKKKKEKDFPKSVLKTRTDNASESETTETNHKRKTRTDDKHKSQKDHKRKTKMDDTNVSMNSSMQMLIFPNHIPYEYDRTGGSDTSSDPIFCEVRDHLGINRHKNALTIEEIDPAKLWRKKKSSTKQGLARDSVGTDLGEAKSHVEEEGSTRDDVTGISDYSLHTPVQDDAVPLRKDASKKASSTNTLYSLHSWGSATNVDDEGSPKARSLRDSAQPSLRDSAQPSLRDSAQPSLRDSAQPSLRDSAQPSLRDSAQPSLRDSAQPSLRDSAQPSFRESTQPSFRDSAQIIPRNSNGPLKLIDNDNDDNDDDNQSGGTRANGSIQEGEETESIHQQHSDSDEMMGPVHHPKSKGSVSRGGSKESAKPQGSKGSVEKGKRRYSKGSANNEQNSPDIGASDSNTQHESKIKSRSTAIIYPRGSSSMHEHEKSVSSAESQSDYFQRQLNYDTGSSTAESKRAPLRNERQNAIDDEQDDEGSIGSTKRRKKGSPRDKNNPDRATTGSPKRRESSGSNGSRGSTKPKKKKRSMRGKGNLDVGSANYGKLQKRRASPDDTDSPIAGPSESIQSLESQDSMKSIPNAGSKGSKKSRKSKERDIPTKASVSSRHLKEDSEGSMESPSDNDPTNSTKPRRSKGSVHEKDGRSTTATEFVKRGDRRKSNEDSEAPLQSSDSQGSMKSLPDTGSKGSIKAGKGKGSVKEMDMPTKASISSRRSKKDSERSIESPPDNDPTSSTKPRRSNGSVHEKDGRSKPSTEFVKHQDSRKSKEDSEAPLQSSDSQGSMKSLPDTGSIGSIKAGKGKGSVKEMDMPTKASISSRRSNEDPESSTKSHPDSGPASSTKPRRSKGSVHEKDGQSTTAIEFVKHQDHRNSNEDSEAPLQSSESQDSMKSLPDSGPTTSTKPRRSNGSVQDKGGPYKSLRHSAKHQDSRSSIEDSAKPIPSHESKHSVKNLRDTGPESSIKSRRTKSSKTQAESVNHQDRRSSIEDSAGPLQSTESQDSMKSLSNTGSTTATKPTRSKGSGLEKEIPTKTSKDSKHKKRSSNEDSEAPLQSRERQDSMKSPPDNGSTSSTKIRRSKGSAHEKDIPSKTSTDSVKHQNRRSSKEDFISHFQSRGSQDSMKSLSDNGLSSSIKSRRSKGSKQEKDIATKTPTDSDKRQTSRGSNDSARPLQSREIEGSMKSLPDKGPTSSIRTRRSKGSAQEKDIPTRTSKDSAKPKESRDSDEESLGSPQSLMNSQESESASSSKTSFYSFKENDSRTSFSTAKEGRGSLDNRKTGSASSFFTPRGSVATTNSMGSFHSVTDMKAAVFDKLKGKRHDKDSNQNADTDDEIQIHLNEVSGFLRGGTGDESRQSSSDSESQHSDHSRESDDDELLWKLRGQMALIHDEISCLMDENAELQQNLMTARTELTEKYQREKNEMRAVVKTPQPVLPQDIDLTPLRLFIYFLSCLVGIVMSNLLSL